jgi:hypothetical protein
MAVSLTTVRGNFQGRSVVLWASVVTGLETISVNGVEVSRKRGFGLWSTHDLSGGPFDEVNRAVVSAMPGLRLVLQRNGEVVASFENRLGGVLLWLIGLVAGLLVAGVLLAAFLILMNTHSRSREGVSHAAMDTHSLGSYVRALPPNKRMQLTRSAMARRRGPRS